MWFTCCHCRVRFDVLGDLAARSAQFYALQPGHTEDKQIGVCDKCWLAATGIDERVERPPTNQPPD
jgi:hypothetical protein